MRPFDYDLDNILEAKLSAAQKQQLSTAVQNILAHDLNIDDNTSGGEDLYDLNGLVDSLIRQVNSVNNTLRRLGLTDEQFEARKEQRRRKAEEEQAVAQRRARESQKRQFRSERLLKRIKQVSDHPVYGRYLTVLSNGYNLVQPSGYLQSVDSNRAFNSEQQILEFIRFIKYGKTSKSDIKAYEDEHGSSPNSPYADLKDKVQTLRDFGFNLTGKLLNTDGATFRTRFSVITDVVVDYSGPYFNPSNSSIEQKDIPGTAQVVVTQAPDMLASWSRGSTGVSHDRLVPYPVKKTINLRNVSLEHLGEIIDTIDTVAYAASGIGYIEDIMLMGDNVVEYVVKFSIYKGVRGSDNRYVPPFNINSMNVDDPMALRKMIYNHVRSNIGYTGERETIPLEDEPPTTQESWDKLMRLKMISELASSSVAAAPAAPPKEAPTKPRPSTPAPSSPPKPSPSPWETPWPSTLPMPEPKAKKGKKNAGGIKETFERSVDRSTQDFWSGLSRNSQHAFGKHPIFAMYGLEKAKRSWQSGVDMLKRLYPNLQNRSNPEITRSAPGLAMEVFQRLLRVERPHHEELAELAVDLVHQVWGVPKHLMDAKFSSRPGMPQDGSGSEEQQQRMGFEVTPPDTARIEGLRDEINKRVTLNTMTQGAAVQNMQTIHHLAAEQLNRIAPELLQFYSKFSAGALSMYWLMDFANLANLSDYAIGDVRLVEVQDEDQNEDEELLDYQPDDEEGQEGQEGQEERPPQPQTKKVKIQARAMVFPVLVQELVKGAMEYLTTLSMADMDEEDRRIVLKQADRMDYEPWQIQVGPELWNAFLKIVPRGATLATVVHKFAGKDPKFVHKILADTIEAVHRNEDPLSPREAIAELMADLESPTPDEDAEWSEGDDDESWRGGDEDQDMEDYT